jgi:hypothetical protein
LVISPVSGFTVDGGFRSATIRRRDRRYCYAFPKIDPYSQVRLRLMMIAGIAQASESSCIETNAMVAIGKESYFMSADGKLMPVRKNQPPPDLNYFKAEK